MTDAKGSRAARGWVFFDRDCPICSALARRFRRTLESRGFRLAALQDPRVRALLNLPPAELLQEMRVATAGGKILGGAAAIVYLARQIWWAWPLYPISRLPGVMHLLGAGYLWFAAHRTCAAGTCSTASCDIDGREAVNSKRIFERNSPQRRNRCES